MDQYKYCPHCKETLPYTAFYSSKKHKSGLRTYCIDCEKSRKKNNRGRDRKRAYKYNTKKHNITQAAYARMFLDHDGRCAICGIHQHYLPRALAIDHDHITGKIRGLLCGKCNTGLGQFDDDQWRLSEAIRYLDKHQE